MPSFSSLFTSLTGAGFYFEKNSRHATYNFNLDSQALYRNVPRLPFEYYINIKLNNVGTAKNYISQFYNNPSWTQVMPLVKTVEMPSMKIETTPLNQYNRKRLSQTKVAFEPVKMVFHDVADGKTLKFWDMYYRYYFNDGNEPGMNQAKQAQSQNGTYSVESLLKNITPSFNPNILGLPASVTNLFSNNSPSGQNVPYNTNGTKADIQNIVAGSLDSHLFGFNLPTVQNVRNLIQEIDIFQVHGGRFNQVTLVNPRISAFTHDVLNYAAGDKTLEITFTMEYEYAYYTIQNLQLTNAATGAGGQQPNNQSSITPFEHAENLELPALAFNATLLDFLESNNPLLTSDNPILSRIGKNVQTSLGALTGSLASSAIRRVSASALNGLANVSPTPYHPTNPAVIQTRPFASTATPTSTAYQPTNLTGGNPGGQ